MRLLSRIGAKPADIARMATLNVAEKEKNVGVRDAGHGGNSSAL
jgi:hypothetical protein